MNGTLTIAETIREIRGALRDYIEATYHVGHPALITQRRALLDEPGNIYQVPYIESTPRYLLGEEFDSLALPDSVKSLFRTMAHPSEGAARLLYDPPYRHQARALEAVIDQELSVVVTTGTGSGKTESFLLPILARLAVEAMERPTSFARPAVRAILLYPMNALVNDQLGRLRLMLGDARVAQLFTEWSGRPARFARYTSRTLYPGVRTRQKDTTRLRSIGQFYVGLLERAESGTSQERATAQSLIENLQRRGKWPAKPDLRAWYGRSGSRWQDAQGNFIRAITGPGDPELLTRYEVLENPPDVLVTNYSMLEYMLMRPLERPIFDMTRDWLEENPNERLLLVVDEAHLYRGAAGAEVGLLLRRLRARLGIPAERLQAICTSASFDDPEYARDFAAQLCGKSSSEFRAIEGTLALRGDVSLGSIDDARALGEVDLERLYEERTEQGRFAAIDGFLGYRSVAPSPTVAQSLYDALCDFGPLSRLVNLTMQEARPLEELGQEIFAEVDKDLADRAVTVLVALGSLARHSVDEPGLLPCRVHAFFRGLPGLWACLDPDCDQLPADARGGPTGALFAQPRDACLCGARVFELFTCRSCGAAYARAYTDDVASPRFLWAEPGGGFTSVGGVVPELQPIDLLLEDPIRELVEPAELDLVTGRLNPMVLGERVRQIFLRGEREADSDGDDDDNQSAAGSGAEFRPCGVCGQQAAFGRSSVQDHQTKGDQPFQALVTRQIRVQPPSAEPSPDFAPLRGRKVLAFSDSRQTAARLAPNLQTYSMQDVLRPLILLGTRRLEDSDQLRASLSLEDLYLAVALGARLLSVRLRPERRSGESLNGFRDVERAVERGALSDPVELQQLLLDMRSEVPPQSLLRGIAATITDRYYGLQSLALASVMEQRRLSAQLSELPDLASLATTHEQKLAVVRLWINQWTAPGIWFQSMPIEWWQTRRSAVSGGVRAHTGKFGTLGKWLEREPKRQFEREWLPTLLDTFCEQVAQGKYRMRAVKLSLDAGGEWAYCQVCRTTQRPFPGSARCIACARDDVVTIDPDTDPVFSARKGYYRNSSLRALGDNPDPPMAIVASEHTAQLGTAQADEVFSKAEEHELLFQDVDIGATASGEPSAAIDVLSCTTTMEVGIDIGTLSGVALRNMPPSRASYQQRSGRAGRRGNAVATVVAFGSADSHDEQYFREPDDMIRGPVDDPVLTLDNAEIARRHVTAFLLQRYHQARLPDVAPEDQPQLFEVLGSVADFRANSAPLNRSDFESWIREREDELVADVDGWLPTEIEGGDRTSLLSALVADTLTAVDFALGDQSVSLESGPTAEPTAEETNDEPIVESAAEEGEEHGAPRRATENLLDRLLYRGVLPRYAFPTDVVAFHVFDREQSTRFRPVFRYSPSQGLPAALTQYAPGKEVWVDGRLWTSGALYSPMREELFNAWASRRLYFECQVCHYARTDEFGSAARGESLDCPACGGLGTFGPARNWIRPPGFAHPVSIEEGTSPDDQPTTSYATRAKLVAPGPAETTDWRNVSSRVRVHYQRTHLLVSNTGPRREGYRYCTLCGLIEPTALPVGRVLTQHAKPYPDDRDEDCVGGRSTRGLVLGTDFISDVLLVSLRVSPPIVLRPGFLATDVALRTLCEALTLAATNRLEIDRNELQAEWRPALSEGGREGTEAEIYVYDTLPGGAGFARRMADISEEVFRDALQVLEQCPSDCDRSCYRCLRSFRNRFEHELLDRYLGASLLRFLLREEQPVLDDVRVALALDRVFADLSRHGIEGARFSRNTEVDIPSIGSVQAPILVETDQSRFIVGIHGPLTPDYAADPLLRDAKEFGSAIPVQLLDEIVVTRSLPYATKLVIEAIG